MRNLRISRAKQELCRPDSEAADVVVDEANDRQSASVNLLNKKKHERKTKLQKRNLNTPTSTNWRFNLEVSVKKRKKKTWKIIEILSDKNYRKVYLRSLVHCWGYFLKLTRYLCGFKECNSKVGGMGEKQFYGKSEVDKANNTAEYCWLSLCSEGRILKYRNVGFV